MHEEGTNRLTLRKIVETGRKGKAPTFTCEHSMGVFSVKKRLRAKNRFTNSLVTTRNLIYKSYKYRSLITILYLFVFDCTVIIKVEY
jgi:hypothetical protein